MKRRVIILSSLLVSVLVLTATIVFWTSHRTRLAAGQRQQRQLEAQLAKERARVSPEARRSLETEIQNLRSRVQQFQECWLSGEEIKQRAQAWSAFWNVTTGAAQESHDFVRRSYQLALTERNVAEWAAIAQAIEAVGHQAGNRLTELSVEASGEANQRRLDRVELTVVVFERKAKQGDRG